MSLNAYTSQSEMNRFNSARLNPLEIPSLKNLDVEKLEEDFAKTLQRKKCLEEREKKEIQKIFDESNELNQLKNRIRMAGLNKERVQQIYEKQTRRMNDIFEEAETEEQMNKRLEEAKRMEFDKEMKKKLDMLNSKYVVHTLNLGHPKSNEGKREIKGRVQG
jgi:hypothetical protein